MFERHNLHFTLRVKVMKPGGMLNFFEGHQVLSTS